MKIGKLKLIGLTLFCIGLTELQAQTVKDIEGNVYKTVTIGTQVWMAENLRTTKYNDGTAIPLVKNDKAWGALTTPAYCWWNNKDATAYRKTYGALYNWYTVNTGKLCPTGWNVPTDAQWTILTDYLTNNKYGYEGSGDDIGKSIASKSGWATFEKAGNVGDDQASNNSSGFTALPIGLRTNDTGAFGFMGYSGFWWSSTEYSISSNAYGRDMNYTENIVHRRDYNKRDGFSVRCLRDL